MNSIIEQRYWDERYANALPVYNAEQVHFKDLFARYLKPSGTCFEVGCYPGRFLIYLGQEFDYTVSGIDATPKVVLLPEHISKNGVKVGTIYNEDFLCHKSAETYDVVCSFGFIEHFYEYEKIIEKHVSLVRPGGSLIISCPNFRRLNYLFHRLVDPENLKRHHLQAMNLSRWKHILTSSGMDLKYHNYYRTAGFWYDTPRSGSWVIPTIKLIDWVTKNIDQRLDWPNSLLSPHMISISQKI